MSGSISKVLVANRAEIARRVFTTCRRLGIATVAVYSEPDAAAPFVADADEAVALGGESAVESYLVVEKLLAAAALTGADAIHPGYGFLAENAGFARAVEAAGLCWIGPPPGAIEAMGSKLGARALMEQAGVSILPGATLDDDSDLEAIGAEIGFPALVKASAGGGGKGMRVVGEASQLAAAVEGARREALSSFGDQTVYLERYLEGPRHIEIQVFADAHGNTVSLGERECSIQRRHQKVIEEAPSPAVDPALRAEMGAAACAAASAVDYRGAGTVEFLLGDDRAYYFLEMNTRLQVEHPVTEMVTGLDLVALQLLVAAGGPLPDQALRPTLSGHAIEARLYAEDVAAGYLPQIGRVDAIQIAGAEPFAAPSGRELAPAPLRLDSGIADGVAVSPHYDPMLAKVISWGPTRGEAAAKLADALERSRLHGLTTNRDFLARILRHPAYLAGETDTAFLARHDGLDQPLADAAADAVHALVAALAAALSRRRDARSGRRGGGGFRNNRSDLQRIGFEAPSGEILIGYAFERDRLIAEIDGRAPDSVVLHQSSPELVDFEFDGVRRRYAVACYRADRVEWWVNSPLGQSRLVELPRYPMAGREVVEGALVAPMPGKVIRLAVAVGETVEAGALVAVLEAMKMEHELTAPGSGIVAEVLVSEGDQLEPGAPIAVIEASEGAGG